MKRIAGIAAALPLIAGTAVIGAAAPAHADPTFFTGPEFNDWYNGARWGDTLGHIEGTYANSVGTWEAGSFGSWNGNAEKKRVWPRNDGGQTVIYFTFVNGAWRAHDKGETGNLQVGGTSYRRECEFPRDNNGPCSPTS